MTQRDSQFDQMFFLNVLQALDVNLIVLNKYEKKITKRSQKNTQTSLRNTSMILIETMTSVDFSKMTSEISFMAGDVTSHTT